MATFIPPQASFRGRLINVDFLLENFSHIAPFILMAAASITGCLYVLFQKKLLPRPISRIVSRLFFYPTFPLTLLMRLGNYWTVMDDTVILGCAPLGMLGVPQKLHDLNVRGVINMCNEFSGPEKAYERLGMKQLRLPTDDHFEPNVSDFQDAVAFIKRFKVKNEKVYIHCKAGHGRAASVAFCWLMSEHPDASPFDMNMVMAAKRKVRKTLYRQKNVSQYVESLKTEMKQVGNKENDDSISSKDEKKYE